MRCNIKDCYWNMWSSHKMFDNENSMQCISENLEAHYDEEDDFKMKPNTIECPGYLSYSEFCGEEK